VIDFSRLKPAIETTFKTISEETTKAVQAKVSELDSGSAEDWLEKGHEFCKKTKGKCPYCSQDLSPSKIAEIYGEYFNRDYKQSLQQLINYKNRILQELSTTPLIGFEAVVAKNNELYSKWNSLIKAMRNATFNVADLQKKLTVAESLVGSLLDKKIKNPLEAQEIDSELQTAITDLEECFKKLIQYNKDIQFNPKTKS
jgi:wobble nucleotide-excising tRNase